MTTAEIFNFRAFERYQDYDLGREETFQSAFNRIFLET